VVQMTCAYFWTKLAKTWSALRTLSLYVKVPSKITSFTLILFYSVYFVSLQLYFLISVYLLYVLSCWQTLISGLNLIIIYVVSVSFEVCLYLYMQGSNLDPGPNPPDLSGDLVSLVTPVVFDTPKWNHKFGECIEQPVDVAGPGDTVTAMFVSTERRTLVSTGINTNTNRF
jgi:hypothetical protein